MLEIIINKNNIVILPDASSLQSSNQGKLNVSNKLLFEVKKAIILPNLKSYSLILLGRLCNNSYKVNLDKKVLTVRKDNEIVIRDF